PAGYELRQNYPNPFNPSTNIDFTIPSPSYVSLKIYNTRGQLVKSLISKQLPSGDHSVIWNGTNEAGTRVGTGIYFCTFKTGSFSSSKRMVLLK
ncbi:MAG: T9SS type A sorting domain-containing protein, partial [bacterium]|nr:T9SS type A sorting domain-containing protein [bacterium]